MAVSQRLRNYLTEYARERRAQFKAAGLCLCGRPRREPDPGETRQPRSCAVCHERTQAKNRRLGAAGRRPAEESPSLVVWTRVTINLTAEAVADYSQFCEAHDMPFHAFIRDALEEFVETTRARERAEAEARAQQAAVDTYDEFLSL